MPIKLTNEQINQLLDDKEEKKLQKILKKEAPELMLRVIHQLRQQEHLQKIEKAYRKTINYSTADMLRDIADSYEDLEDQNQNMRDELDSIDN